ncbi:MAG: hypothetical protein OJF47_000494 [Nitrospira sp.]|jgi:hypothetical protein|nr:MAG: hypothetical protein OJF47_000494 [Nitrospira sp.]
MGLREHKAVASSGDQAIRFLVALIGPTHFAFPAQWVCGIMTSVEAGSEGPVLWAHFSYEWTDLSGRLTIGLAATTAEARVVLYGNEQRSRAFVVHGVLGLVDAERTQVHPLPPQFRGGERDRLLGFLVEPGYVALIINPFWVLELPSRKEVLDTFQVSEPRSGRDEFMLRLSSTDREGTVSVSSSCVT